MILSDCHSAHVSFQESFFDKIQGEVVRCPNFTTTSMIQRLEDAQQLLFAVAVVWRKDWIHPLNGWGAYFGPFP